MYRIFISVLFSAFLSGCFSVPAEPEDYVLIFIGSSLRSTDNTLADSTDKNAFFIEGALVYNEFIKRGVAAENIYFLYKDGKPDFSDPLLEDLREGLEQEFSDRGYNHEASVVNLLSIERQIQRKLSKGSNFFLILDAHGVVDRFGFKIRSEFDKSYLRSTDIRSMMIDNRGRNHLFIGSCYSGQFFRDVTDINARVITACPADKAVWLDRDVSFAREYFSRIPKDLSSSEFLYNSAFDKAVLKFQRWGNAKMPYIKSQYEGTGLADYEILDWSPVMRNIGRFE